jgi:hypothetical protein
VTAPVSVLVAFRSLGACGVLAGLAASVGIPATLVFYLTGPDMRQAVGAPESTHSRAMSTGLVLVALVAGSSLFVWLFMEVAKAVGTGVR